MIPARSRGPPSSPEARAWVEQVRLQDDAVHVYRCHVAVVLEHNGGPKQVGTTSCGHTLLQYPPAKQSESPH